MSAPDSRPALPIHLPFDSISPSFSKNSPCVFQVLGYYLTSLGEMPCGWLLCTYAETGGYCFSCFLLWKKPAMSKPNQGNYIHKSVFASISLYRLVSTLHRSLLQRFTQHKINGNHAMLEYSRKINSYAHVMSTSSEKAFAVRVSHDFS